MKECFVLFKSIILGGVKFCDQLWISPFSIFLNGTIMAKLCDVGKIMS